MYLKKEVFSPTEEQIYFRFGFKSIYLLYNEKDNILKVTTQLQSNFFFYKTIFLLHLIFSQKLVMDIVKYFKSNKLFVSFLWILAASFENDGRIGRYQVCLQKKKLLPFAYNLYRVFCFYH